MSFFMGFINTVGKSFITLVNGFYLELFLYLVIKLGEIRPFSTSNPCNNMSHYNAGSLSAHFLLRDSVDKYDVAWSGD